MQTRSLLTHRKRFFLVTQVVTVPAFQVFSKPFRHGDQFLDNLCCLNCTIGVLAKRFLQQVAELLLLDHIRLNLVFTSSFDQSLSNSTAKFYAASSSLLSKIL